MSSFLSKVWQYDSAKAVKERLRPVKHAIFGKNGIYRWLDVISTSRRANPVQVVFDVGAAVGDKTITFLHTFPQAVVYCFEPQKASFARLSKRTGCFARRVKLFNVGLYDKTCTLSLRITSYNDASSILPMAGLEDTSIKETGAQEIKVYRLDEFLAEQDVPIIDLVKIDVEGVEKEVLAGAAGTLAQKILNVIVEISPLRKGAHSNDHIEVFRRMHDAGFTFVGCDDDYFFTKDPAVLSRYYSQVPK